MTLLLCLHPAMKKYFHKPSYLALRLQFSYICLYIYIYIWRKLPVRHYETLVNLPSWQKVSSDCHARMPSGDPGQINDEHTPALSSSPSALVRVGRPLAEDSANERSIGPRLAVATATHTGNLLQPVLPSLAMPPPPLPWPRLPIPLPGQTAGQGAACALHGAYAVECPVCTPATRRR